MLIIVVMKLIAPRIDDTPARCREKIVRSTEAPAWAKFPAKGGYTVHPVPAPASTIEDASSNRKDVEVVRNLCCLYVERPYRELRLLAVRVSYQNPQS